MPVWWRNVTRTEPITRTHGSLQTLISLTPHLLSAHLGPEPLRDSPIARQWLMVTPSPPPVLCPGPEPKCPKGWSNWPVMGGTELLARDLDPLTLGGEIYRSSYAPLPALATRAVLRPVIQALPDSFTYKSFVQKLRWIDELSDYDAGRRYAEATAFFRFSHARKQELYSEELWRELARSTPARSLCVSTTVPIQAAPGPYAVC